MSIHAEKAISAAEKELRRFRKDTFKMSGEDAQAADIFWASPARSMMFLNFAAMAGMIFAGVRIPSVDEGTHPFGAHGKKRM